MKMYIFYLLILSVEHCVQAGEIQREIYSVRHGLKNVRKHLNSHSKSGSLKKIAQLRRSIKFMELCIEELNKIKTKNQQQKVDMQQALASYEEWKTQQISLILASQYSD